MSKERLMAFTDAILAIIMTILVLELAKPAEATWAAVWALRGNLFAYTVSFFWLGAMWINIHNIWQNIERISTGVLWWSIVMLFFSSLIPYVTSFASDHMMSKMALSFYWVVVMLVSVSNILLNNAVEKANADVEGLVAVSDQMRKWMWLDLGLKFVGLLVAVTVFPPAAMFSILLAGVVPTLAIQFHGRRRGR
jgi:uncharacterized membrane protein